MRRQVADDEMILDMGPDALAALERRLHTAQYSGLERPAGRLRDAALRRRHREARADGAALTKAGDCCRVAGGGDTVAALKHAGVADEFSYVSTAGGAFLEWLEGRELPGVAALATSKGKLQ